MPEKYAILGGEALSQNRRETLSQNRNFEWDFEKKKTKNKKTKRKMPGKYVILGYDTLTQKSQF